MKQQNAEPTLYRLSKSQHEQMTIAGGSDVGANVNLVGMLLWFDGDSADSELERAVNLIVEHEQALRLRFTERDGEIFQYETKYGYMPIAVENTPLSREEVVKRESRLMNAVAFVHDGPLVDFKIIRTASEVGLRGCFHHGVMDGLSGVIFSRRLGWIMRRIREGGAVDCAAHRFTDSLKDEDDLLGGERRWADVRYWREKIRDWPGLCAMNPGVAPSASMDGKQLARKLSREYGRRINAHCERFAMTPAHLFQTALAIYLLHRNPGIRYADMGQTMAARRNAREKETLGNFAFELYLRIPVDDGDAIARMRESVKAANFDSLAHSLCTYEDIVAMKREEVPGLESMRDLMFTFIPPLNRPGTFDMDWLANDSPETSVEFLVFQFEDEELFSVVFDYRTDVYADEEAEAAFDDIMRLVDICLAGDAETVKDARMKIERKRG